MEVGARVWKDKLNIYHLELTPFIILLDHVVLLILCSIIIFSLKINGFLSRNLEPFCLAFHFKLKDEYLSKPYAG